LWLQLGDFELVWAEINVKGSMGRRRQQGFDGGIVMAGGRATRAWVLSFSFFFLARHFHLFFSSSQFLSVLFLCNTASLSSIRQRVRERKLKGRRRC
jgi:hypothetical protein